MSETDILVFLVVGTGVSRDSAGAVVGLFEISTPFEAGARARTLVPGCDGQIAVTFWNKRHCDSPCWNSAAPRFFFASRSLLLRILHGRRERANKNSAGFPMGTPHCFVIFLFLHNHKSTTVFPLRKPKIEIGYKCVLHELCIEYSTT
jgi:hypothetical protein